MALDLKLLTLLPLLLEFWDYKTPSLTSHPSCPLLFPSSFLCEIRTKHSAPCMLNHSPRPYLAFVILIPFVLTKHTEFNECLNNDCKKESNFWTALLPVNCRWRANQSHRNFCLGYIIFWELYYIKSAQQLNMCF